MKKAHLILSVLLGIAAITPESVLAQNNNNSNRQGRIVSVIEIAPGSLQDAANQIQQILDQQHLEPINVVLSDSATELEVPNLVLKNVQGSQALQLIAAAAGCQFEPILSLENETIGYRLFESGRSRLASVRMVPNTDVLEIQGNPAATAQPQAQVRSSGFGNVNRTAVPKPLRGVNVVDASSSGNENSGASIERYASETAGIASYGGGYGAGARGSEAYGFSGGGGKYGSAQSNRPFTKIYPMAAIIKSSSMQDVQDAIHSMFEVEGIDGKDVKLSFHDGTGVLMVRGRLETHALIEDLLRSLNQNREATVDLEEARESATLKMELEVLRRAYERMNRQVEELRYAYPG